MEVGALRDASTEFGSRDEQFEMYTGTGEENTVGN